MQENIIAIINTAINGESIQTCNARELHAFLEVKSNFRDWIKNRIADYNFVEGMDYVKIAGESRYSNLSKSSDEGFAKNLAKVSTGGRPTVEYFLTLDMAKELAMVERNEKGREARKYFIECERRVKEGETVRQIPMTPVEQAVRDYTALCGYIGSTFNVPQDRVSAAVLASVEKATGCEVGEARKLIPSKPRADVYELTPTQIGKKLNPAMTAAAVNKMLETAGFIANESTNPKRKEWKLTDTAKGYGEMRAYERNGHSGYQIQWSERVVSLLQAVINEEK